MEFHTEQRGAILIATIKGRFDRHAVDLVKQERSASSVWEFDTSVSCVIVELTEVDFVDSLGLAVLVNAGQIMNRRGGKVLLVNPSEAVNVILQYSRLDKAFVIYSTLDEAIAQSTTSSGQ